MLETTLKFRIPIIKSATKQFW